LEKLGFAVIHVSSAILTLICWFLPTRFLAFFCREN